MAHVHDAGTSATSHEHAHAHDHTHAHDVTASPGRSLLQMSALDRLLVTLVPVGILWLAVVWSLGGFGGTP